MSVVVVVVGVALVAAACAPPTIDNLKPVAVAAASTVSGPAPLEVQFSAAGSSDADGTIASFSWDFGDGSDPSTTSDATHVYTEPGAYTAALTVRDDDGAEATATVQIEVASVNQSPTAVISASTTTGRAPLSVQFTGSGSVDADGVLTSHSWDFGDGTSSDQADTTHVFAEPGTYVVTLRVTDDDGATSMASTTVTAMTNQAPTAVATADPTSGPVPLTVAFTGSGSSDPDGSVVSYSWDFGDGTSSTEVDPTHIYATEGTHVATLTVTDDNGGTDTASVQVGPSSAPENEAPSAVVAASPEVGVAPLEVDFTGSSSSDPDGQVASYSWDFGDGATSSEADPAHTYTTPGSYTAMLTVTDVPGLTDTATVAIEVTSNQAPVAVLNATPQSGPQPLMVDFDASGSTDPEGTHLSYAWNFGDGSTGSGVAPEHVYAEGDYTATLVVTDGAGAASDPVSIDIEVYNDDDGDGYRSATDCDDGDAGVHPGASDTLDTQSAEGFKDSNCDGVDGVVSETVFVRAPGGGDGPGCGELAAPCATVGAGIEAALASGRATVQVAAGSYPGFSVDGGSALTVRGGYQPSFDGRAAAPTTVVGAGVGAHFDGTRSTTLFDLEVDGGSGAESTGMLVENSGQITLSRVRVDSGEAVGAGSSTYGVRVLTRSGISIRNSSVVARPGRAGTDGAGGATGIAGSAGLGGNPPFGAPPLVGGSGGLGAPTCTGQDPRWGGKGGDGSNGITQTAPGGSGYNGCGGALGGRGQLLPVGGNWCAAPAVGGAQGRSGQTGGTPGIGSAAVSLSARLGATYMRSQGANGGVGANGQGGAGGGGGIGGGGGGAGGLGGSGGAGGVGGSDGGGSFGVYVFGASVGIISSEVTASAGGAGGLGGSGGAGGAGGAGGRGGPGSQPPYTLGCNGGAGGGGAGAGAGGGGGGGGAAGPSVALVVQDFVNIQMGSASLRRSDEVAHGGTGGSSGAGGQPGARGLGSNGAGNGGFGAVGFPGVAGAAGSDSLNARWVRNGVVVDP